MEPGRAVESALRDSYGRLLAFLAARTRDIAMAEDALSDAFRAALETWPRDGVPQNPEAWLSTAAKRKLVDIARKHRREDERLNLLQTEMNAVQAQFSSVEEFPDQRAEMLFLCAHPAIDETVRTPLMLQVVLGLDAARIANAFLIQPTAMGQRLSRAKAKIRDARIRFELPASEKLPERLESVLDAVYVAFGTGWGGIDGEGAKGQNLVQEALSLGALLVHQFPEEPEVHGLQSLMLFCESRREARQTSDGAYVPLSEQQTAQWSAPMIAAAENHLAAAARFGRIGRFQLEAAIQSVHAHRRRVGFTDWHAISLLYEGLLRIAPSTGAELGRAAAVAEAQGPAAGWNLLQGVNQASVENHQPYWALAAHLLRSLDRPHEARAAYQRAIGLAQDRASREFLIEQCERLRE